MRHTDTARIKRQFVRHKILCFPYFYTRRAISNAPIIAPKIRILVLTSPQKMVSDLVQPNFTANAGSKLDQDVAPRPNWANPRVMTRTLLRMRQTFIPVRFEDFYSYLSSCWRGIVANDEIEDSGSISSRSIVSSVISELYVVSILVFYL